MLLKVLQVHLGGRDDELIAQSFVFFILLIVKLVPKVLVIADLIEIVVGYNEHAFWATDAKISQGE